MTQAAPAVRELARRLLALEVGEDGRSDARAALRALDELRIYLARLVGVAGFQALLARALALAKAEAPWLAAVHVDPGGTPLGLYEAALGQSAEAVEQGNLALLSQSIGLLVTFIGAALTMRMVRDIWPDALVDDIRIGLEERP